jgi:hypothetical protein
VDDGFSVEVIEVSKDLALSSSLDVTRMRRSKDRAILEKLSLRLSHEPCFGINTKVKRPSGWVASHLLEADPE